MRISTRKIAYIGVLTALCFIATAFISVPSVGGGHTNLSDAVIFIAAWTVGPLGAFAAGGLGTFFADLAFYPATMFYSFVIHGLEGIICGLIMKALKRTEGKILKGVFACFAMIISGIFMIIMFFLAKWLMYGTWQTALISLPRNIIQAAMSVVISMIVIFMFKLPNEIENYK